MNERTFAVNVVAPYVIAGWIDTDVGAKREGVGGKIESVERGVDFGGAEIDFENVDGERRDFRRTATYSLSKAAMKAMSYEMFDRLEAGRLCGGEASVDDLNVFSCDPGTVNTKMLLGWGRSRHRDVL